MYPKHYGVFSLVTMIFSDIENIETIVYIPIKASNSKTLKHCTSNIYPYLIKTLAITQGTQLYIKRKTSC